MDSDDPHPAFAPPRQHANAVAGPSSLPDIPPLYFPPPGPPQPPPYFRSTDDLLRRFQLLPAYDKYVRPYAPPVSQLSAADKGKAKEIPLREAASSPAAGTPAAGGDGDDDDGGKGEKKMKNYKHLIKSVPGKHSMKKDDYLATLMAIPPKQKMEIKPFSQKTTREAFAVSLEGLKGWNIHTLVSESSQAREDRKRRKELRKLAKAQGQSLVQAVAAPPAALPNTPGMPATPGAAPTPGAPPAAVAAPRTSTPRPGTAKVPPTQQQQPPARGRTPVGIGTPQSVSTPGSPPSQPGIPPARGTKREREEGALQSNGNVPPASQVPGPDAQRVAKAGVPGVRPRPVKKQRLEGNGPPPMPFQQPTPHS
ncbi:uncharacterized protein BXZ73DRAFT_46172 [Epithele typhae]|uniref:uncharacterized protein n=1 Tax=Epithele typhae TaxID=378194 RepID=UPI0020073068|nr:uncharacterized protein BXZ73DRAFT_46172 [Epithele typhae]KAH9933639.1 hypothetical protein BXZ73DRAFT_46172 [Epithele typhae]